MKRYIALCLLAACSDPVQTGPSCQPHTCAEFHHEMAPVCGKVYDGCSKELDCGPCDVSDPGGGLGTGGDSLTGSVTSSVSSSTTSTTSTTSSGSGDLGEGGANMCEDLTFEK